MNGSLLAAVVSRAIIHSDLLRQKGAAKSMRDKSKVSPNENAA